MRSRLLAGVFAAALAMVACGADDGDPDAAAPVSPADQLDFSATAVDGTTVDAGDYVGSDLVIWFWAPW